MQQINLYQPLFRKQEKIFSAKTMLQGAALVLAGMLLFFAYAAWQTYSLEAQVTQFVRQRDDATRRVTDLARAMPERSKNMALEQEVVRLRADLRDKQRVVAQLADRRSGNTTGYAAHLEGLARQRLPQLWLTQIGLRGGGSVVELRGSAFNPEQVPQYLQRLSAESAFSGVEFRQFTLSRAEKAPQQVDFVLLTERVETR
ncbi:MAG: PilN domain-containing protein [Pseudomonadota bacterium]